MAAALRGIATHYLLHARAGDRQLLTICKNLSSSAATGAFVEWAAIDRGGGKRGRRRAGRAVFYWATTREPPRRRASVTIAGGGSVLHDRTLFW